MQDWIERILGELLSIASSEGIKFVRARAIAAYVRVVQGLRRALLLHYVIIVLCFLNAFSLFFGLYFASMQIFEASNPTFIVPLCFCTMLFVFSFSRLAFTLREKTWIKTFRIEELVDSAMESHHEKSSAVDSKEIERIVEKVLEEKLQNIKSKKNKHKSE